MKKTVRECDGFHHPLAEVWTGNDGLGEVRSFMNNEGMRKSYTLQTISRTGPRATTDYGSDPNLIRCWETAQYLYVQSNTDIAYEFNFLQRDAREDQPTESQNVELVENTQNPVGQKTDANLRRWLWLKDLDVNGVLDTPDGTNWPRTSGYFPEGTINGTFYSDLLQHTFTDNSERFTSGLVDEEAQWVRVLVARDVGLMQYELLNGTVYTLTTD